MTNGRDVLVNPEEVAAVLSHDDGTIVKLSGRPDNLPLRADLREIWQRLEDPDLYR